MKVYLCIRSAYGRLSTVEPCPSKHWRTRHQCRIEDLGSRFVRSPPLESKP